MLLGLSANDVSDKSEKYLYSGMYCSKKIKQFFLLFPRFLYGDRTTLINYLFFEFC